GGGSAGAGGGASVVSKTESWEAPRAGDSLFMNVGHEDISITSVVMSVDKDADDLTLQVTSHGARPDTSVLFEGKTYQYLEFVKTGAAVRQATLSFTVDDSWVSSNAGDPSLVKIFRYRDNFWHELETSYIGIVNGKHDYKSVTPGFSYFVVGIAEKSSVPAVIETAPVDVSDVTEPISAASSAVVPVRSSNPLKNMVIAGACLAFIILALVLLRSWKHDRYLKR
ncbi:MAG TPA: PGF-pre-PGF domain-containing protein, partial [Candidatus Nanoarchaeia archaeon]|nr:PGF-pre-PGF domain-containing protein [Candidatus Nanoarchaeia archaeon]